PLAAGLGELRAAAARWVGRRFGAALDPDTEVVPTLGSKEAIFSLAQIVVNRASGRDVVVVPTPGYPVAARGAAFAGAEVLEAVLDPARGWLPDPDALPWDRVALVWLTSPGNPTGAVAPPALMDELAARCRAHGAVLASDEAYCELWFGDRAPHSALELADRTGVLAFHTLSKRSSMPGYRSGFVAGDPELVAALKRFRPSVGTAPQTFVQRASVAAWDHDDHVAQARARYAAKREVLLPALLDLGLEDVGGDASFFLWLRVAAGDDDDEAFAARLLTEVGIVVAPGSYLGTGGSGHVRVALVPNLEACARAAELLAGWRP
nr:aminotransferase class I/II-fold pyridoxal phosphate-dependent enzyme [Solirubrobacterales bacterium]